MNVPRQPRRPPMPTELRHDLAEVLDLVDRAIENDRPSEALWLKTWIRPTIRRAIAWGEGRPSWRQAGDQL